MPPTLPFAIATVWILRQLAPAAGALEHCPCLTSFSDAWLQRWMNTTGNCQIYTTALYTGNVADPNHCYPANYGLGQCQTWDSGMDPFCSQAIPPSWCSDAWCFVNTSTCTLTDRPTPSPRTVQGSGGSIDGTPHYSYATCSVQSDFAKYRRAALKSATEIVAIIENYVAVTRDFFERQVKVLKSEEAANTACSSFLDSCDCPATECKSRGGSWGDYKVDFGKLTVTHTGGRSSSPTADEKRAQCLSLLAQSEFKQIGRLEYNDPDRLAFIQYGDQASGVYFSWPGLLWCPTTFDPRFRPWYVSAVSGPKDVVIVLDKSSSMNQAGRWSQAVEGAKRVLDTLTEFDYAGIVLFSNGAVSFDGLNSLESVTQERLSLMRQWLDDQAPLGGTDFRSGFEKAFSLIEQSKSNGKTSGCNQVVLFLTDGEDTSGIAAEDVTALNTDKAAVFTFSFGNDAAKVLPKSIACANWGIWYHIADGQDISKAMSGYYLYYANSLAFQKQIRWSDYKELETGNDLMSGCLPAYDRDVTPPVLLGVICMDTTVIMDIHQFRLKPDFAAAQEKMVSETSKCTIVRPSENELEGLRGDVSSESSCGSPIADSTFPLQVSRSVAMAGTVSAALVAFT